MKLSDPKLRKILIMKLPNRAKVYNSGVRLDNRAQAYLKSQKPSPKVIEPQIQQTPREQAVIRSLKKTLFHIWNLNLPKSAQSNQSI